MSVYLICFRSPDGEKAHYKHAGHYIGYAGRGETPEASVEARLHEHRTGYGAALTRAAVESGIDLVVSRVWPEGTKNDEWRLRCRSENPRLCPFCNPEAYHLAQGVGHD